MLMSSTFVVLIRFDFKPSMLLSCTFVVLIKIDCKPFMLMSCTFVVLIISNYNPSMAISCTTLLLFTLSIKVFEFEPNLSRKHWNVIKFASSSENDMARKLICNKEEL